ncbi:hypothetical protein [Novosphingobium mangrovi (ex Hu et al. 2023)]|uniref:Lysozyme n=1 Tax=Novosphingobium mangrovi (ex Hu et al. 2023) TaxID=2930094 RepID=A0ABT0A8Z0_9SPHN|nr:hypothetical protein [Novosphingobium mangrovi (ex Hu et al. 2023)]MCJ1959647.1 hypothetical protein [Novosphingobium mangrovi (ex Hu et al. 2023)]
MSRPWLVAAACGAGVALYAWHEHSRAEQWQARAGLEAASHRQTKENYRAAQDEAARLEAARLAQVKAHQEEVTDAVAKDYAARLADLRARYQRLRDQTGSAAGGAADRVAVPAVPDASRRTDEAADLRLAGAAGACLTPDERLIAAELALQLGGLIDWVEGQGS